LGEIFSDLFDFVRLKKIPGCSKLSANFSWINAYPNEEENLKKFSKILRILDAKALNKIMSFLPHFGFFKNIFSEYLWCTPKYAKKMGFDAPEDLIGKSDLYFPWSFEMATSYQEADEQVLLTSEANYRKEQWIFKEDINEDIIVAMHRYPVFDSNGHVIGIFGVGKEDVVATQLSKIATQTSREKISFSV
jgi:hypothetical protein